MRKQFKWLTITEHETLHWSFIEHVKTLKVEILKYKNHIFRTHVCAQRRIVKIVMHLMCDNMQETFQ